MADNTATSRLDDVFVALRKELPHRYMAGLAALLPGLKDKEIWYAMEVRCKDLKLKEQVKEAMTKLVQNTKERRLNLGKV